MSDVDHIILLVDTITLNILLDRTYEFINGMTIQYLMYWTYSRMDVYFANPMQIVTTPEDRKSVV